MKYVLAFLVVTTANVFAQFPVGRYFSIFPDKAAIVTLDSAALSLEGGNPVFDNVKKTITLDSAQDGQRIGIEKIQALSKTHWLVVGKVAEPTKTVFAILDLIAIDPETFELNFRRDEFPTREEAEARLGDTAAAFGFRFMSGEKVRRLMSLRPITELTAPDLISVYRATSDSVEVLTQQLKDQPDIAFFAMMIRPMQITINELAARGYNPLVQNAQIEAVIDKLKADPEVKKELDEIDAKLQKSGTE